jgi:hypothetical protein
METNISIFKVGDRVFDIRYGWGEVTRNDPKANTLDVRFSGSGVIVYSNHLNNIWKLSFTEYRLQGFSQERPEPLPEIGDAVWVRDTDDQQWLVMHFFGMEGTRVKANRYYDESTSICWNQMTTKNPYKQQKNEN